MAANNNINIKIDNSFNKLDTIADNITFYKMLFLFNAINDGWSVKKKNNSYIFKKKHEGKEEIFEEDYLHKFMKTNFNILNR
jgi:hypothetical protein